MSAIVTIQSVCPTTAHIQEDTLWIDIPPGASYDELEEATEWRKRQLGIKGKWTLTQILKFD